jgi:hypothetical protein
MEGTSGGSGTDDDASAGEASGGETSSGDEIPAGITLRVGEQSPVGELSFELAGLNDGLPYEIEYVRFDSGPLVNEGFAAGEIDIGSMGDNPVIGAAARDLPVTVLATSNSDGPGNLLVARPGSGVETLDDLEGKKVAFTRTVSSDARSVAATSCGRTASVAGSALLLMPLLAGHAPGLTPLRLLRRAPGQRRVVAAGVTWTRSRRWA